MGQNLSDQTASYTSNSYSTSNFYPSSNASATSAEPVSSSSSSGGNTPIYMQAASVGFLALLMAMVLNAESVQNLVANGEMFLSEQVSQETQSYSTAWLTEMSNPNGNGNATTNSPGTDPGDTWLLAYWKANNAWPQDPPGITDPNYWYGQLSDIGKLTYDSLSQFSGNQGQSGIIQEDVTKYNLDNTQYNQMTSFFSGITSGLSDTINNTNNQVSLDYQQIQLNTLAVQQTLVQVL